MNVYSILFKMVLPWMLIEGCLWVFPEKSMAADRGVKFQINLMGEFINLYLINASEDIIVVYPRISYSGVERNVEFFFYSRNKKCDECALKLTTSMLHAVPPVKSVTTLAPGEIIGRRFNLSSLASSHALKPGCYGVYATYQERRPPAGAFAGKLVSNAVHFCTHPPK